MTISKRNGVAWASIAKIAGIAVASISKVSGISKPSAGGEDLTAYTETDPSGYLTVTSSKVTITAIPREDTGTYLYSDMGAGNINGISIDFEGYRDSSSHNSGTINLGVGNDGENAFNSWTDGVVIWWSDSQIKMLAQSVGGVDDSSALLSNDTLYYFTLSRAADSSDWYLYIYSDAARTSLVDTLNATMGGSASNTFEYVYAFAPNGAALAYLGTGYFQNFVIN